MGRDRKKAPGSDYEKQGHRSKPTETQPNSQEQHMPARVQRPPETPQARQTRNPPHEEQGKLEQQPGTARAQSNGQKQQSAAEDGQAEEQRSLGSSQAWQPSPPVHEEPKQHDWRPTATEAETDDQGQHTPATEEGTGEQRPLDTRATQETSETSHEEPGKQKRRPGTIETQADSMYQPSTTTELAKAVDGPRDVTLADVLAAAHFLNSYISPTPCEYSKQFSEETDMKVYLKEEHLLPSGSFKVREAQYILGMMVEECRTNGVLTSSGTNFALALAHVGRCMGVPVTAVFPKRTPYIRRRCLPMLKENDAEVVFFQKQPGEEVDEEEFKEFVENLAVTKNRLYIDRYDNLLAIAAAGTVGLEIVEQMPDVDAIVVPVGSGNLITGIAVVAKHLRPCIKIIGVEAASNANFAEAIKVGHPCHVRCVNTIVQGLRVPAFGTVALRNVQAYVDYMMTVKDSQIAIAICKLLDDPRRRVLEGAGAIGLAALNELDFPNLREKKVVVVLTGRNICTDPTLHRSLMNYFMMDCIFAVLLIEFKPQTDVAEELSLILASQEIAVYKMTIWKHYDMRHGWTMRVRGEL